MTTLKEALTALADVLAKRPAEEIASLSYGGAFSVKQLSWIGVKSAGLLLMPNPSSASPSKWPT